MIGQQSRDTRREFVAKVAGINAAAAISRSVQGAQTRDSSGGDLVDRINHGVIFDGRTSGDTWFLPRPCIVPGAKGPVILMTLQSITGSDVFGQVHWSVSQNGGGSWSPPQPIASFGRRPLDGSMEVGVCDVLPEYHPRTNVTLAVGHNVYYKDGVLARPQRARWPVYAVRSSDGKWSGASRLDWNDPRGSQIYTCGSGQRVLLDSGEILIPLSFAPSGRMHRSVTSALCAFDGTELRIQKVGTELANSSNRGLLEPSLTTFDGRYFVTIRAEDERGYVAESKDGLHWNPQRPWCWDDGEPLTMSTTQQHWLVHSEQLFLVYTRKAKENVKVIRWRAPLYMAAVDHENLRLIRATERVVLPLLGDAAHDPLHVALMGNFHTLAVSPAESWVTVGENRSRDGWAGDTLLARIRWKRPNRLMTA